MLVPSPLLFLVLVAVSSAVATLHLPYAGLGFPIPITPRLIYGSPESNANLRGFSYSTRAVGGKSDVVFISGPDSKARMRNEVGVMHDLENSLVPQSDINVRQALPEAAFAKEPSFPETASRPREDTFIIEPLIPTASSQQDNESTTNEVPDIENKNSVPEKPSTVPQEPSTTSEQPSLVPEQPKPVPEQPTVPEQSTTVPEQPTTIPCVPSIVPSQPPIVSQYPSIVPVQPSVFPAPYPFFRLDGSVSLYPHFPSILGGQYGPSNFFRNQFNPYYRQYNPYTNPYNPFFAPNNQYYNSVPSPFYPPATRSYDQNGESFNILGSPASVRIFTRFDNVEQLNEPQQFSTFPKISEQSGSAFEQPAPVPEESASSSTESVPESELSAISPEQPVIATKQSVPESEQSTISPEQPAIATRQSVPDSEQSASEPTTISPEQITSTNEESSKASEESVSENSEDQTNPTEQPANESANVTDATTTVASDAVAMS